MAISTVYAMRLVTSNFEQMRMAAPISDGVRWPVLLDMISLLHHYTNTFLQSYIATLLYQYIVVLRAGDVKSPIENVISWPLLQWGWPPTAQIARSGHCSLVLLHDDVMTAVNSYNRT